MYMRPVKRLPWVAILVACWFSRHVVADDSVMTLTARVRGALPRADGRAGRVIEQARRLNWKPRETAVIICDMWDQHWCKCATARVVTMAPRMNQAIAAARQRGMVVVHAPSDCMAFYRGAPQRRLAQTAPEASNAPAFMNGGCQRLTNEPPMPVDSSDGGCDDVPTSPGGNPWRRQIDSLTVADADAVSDSGVEIWNLFEARGIKHVILMGVHTNMCVVGRPFGLRQWVRAGKDVVLVRDLTDAMYNPAKPPFVSHRRGTELIIAHIEQHICPSTTSDQITGRRQGPHVVCVIGEDEYRTDETLPDFACRELLPLGCRVSFLFADREAPHRVPGLEQIEQADVVLLSVRRRAPSNAQLAALRRYLAAGRPLVAIRTSSHAFDAKQVLLGHANWSSFDTDVLGAKYRGHYSKDQASTAHVAKEAAGHSILHVVPTEFAVDAHLYRFDQLQAGVEVLLKGMHTGQSNEEPVAWTNIHKGGRIFSTSLGSAGDFATPAFRQLLVNAVFWALELPTPLWNRS